MALLQRLDHPGVLKLHGQCYDNSLDPEIRVIAMLKLGSPLEMIQLLQTPWEERFKLFHRPTSCVTLGKLLHLSVLLPFLLSFFCKTKREKSFILKCTAAGKCDGLSEKKNLFNAYRYFFTYLLPHTAPSALRPLLGDILNATGTRAFEKVLHLYKSGCCHTSKKSEISRTSKSIFVLDYKCWPCYSHLGCLLSIYNAEEAAAICNSQPQCQSFIVTQQRTWTGRPLTSFQSSLTDLIPDVNSVLYIKRSTPSRERL
uniref:Protein kinase domain-containing protein n=1 Tax=Chelonoidis abingdonii TaxID=106734 RepID=A0A8C0HEW9_CHEAB